MSERREDCDEPQERETAGSSSQIRPRSLAKPLPTSNTKPLPTTPKVVMYSNSQERPKYNKKAVFKRIAVRSTQRPSQVSLALSEHLSEHLSKLKGKAPTPADPKDLEIAMLKENNAALKTVVKDCHTKLLNFQNRLHEMSCGVRDVMQKLECLTNTGIVVKQPALKCIVSKAVTRKEPKIPLQTWEELKAFEISLSSAVVFNRAVGSVRTATSNVTFKRLTTAMTAVLKATMSSELQNLLERRAALFNNVHLLKNYVCLFNQAIRAMCPSRRFGVAEEKDIRLFLSAVLGAKADPIQPKPSDDLIQVSLQTHTEANTNKESIVKWLEGEDDEGSDQAMNSDETVSEEECDFPAIVPLEPMSPYDSTAIKIEVE